MNYIYIDCRNGVSGDMLLKAFTELGGGAPAAQGRGVRGPEEGHGRSYSCIRKMIEDSGYSREAKAAADRIYLCIALAEAFVHGRTLDDVHFHEVGRDEAVSNALGTAAAAETAKRRFGAERICVSPVYDGCGSVECSHGTVPVPVPAVARMMELCSGGREIMRDHGLTGGAGFEFRRDDEVHTEMVTPSGLAALIGLGAEGGPAPEEGKVLKKVTVRGTRNIGSGLSVYAAAE